MLQVLELLQNPIVSNKPHQIGMESNTHKISVTEEHSDIGILSHNYFSADVTRQLIPIPRMDKTKRQTLFVFL